MASWRMVGAVGVLALAAAAACKDATSPLVGSGQTVALSFMGTTPKSGAPAPAFSVMGTDSLVVPSSDTNKLVITSVQLVLRRIELHRLQDSATSCDSVPREEGCGEFELGTMLVSLPLDTGIAQALAVPIDSGTYSSIEFKIHKPGGDSVDTAFHLANPSWPANTSIMVQGTFDGTPFTYTTQLDLEQEIEFNPALVVDASGTSTNVTIRMDVSTWFMNGTVVIDPNTALSGQPSEGLVNSNIEHSVKAFKDRNRDGRESDG